VRAAWFRRGGLPDTNQIWLAAGADCRSLAALCRRTARLLERLVGLPFILKLLVSTGLLVPLGFAMGVPFPTGLRAVARGIVGAPVSPADDASGNLVEWAWAMNAASSVLGSVLAIIIAIQFGFSVTLATGAGAYLVALLLTTTLRLAQRVPVRYRLRRRQEPSWRCNDPPQFKRYATFGSCSRVMLVRLGPRQSLAEVVGVMAIYQEQSGNLAGFIYIS